MRFLLQQHATGRQVLRHCPRSIGCRRLSFIEQTVGGACHVLAGRRARHCVDDIMDKPVANGVKLFSDAFDRLLAAIKAQRRNLAG
jgi:hypothetical protein